MDSPSFHIHFHHTVVGPELRKLTKFLFLFHSGATNDLCALVQAPTRSTWNDSHIHSKHLCWMGRWIHHHSTFTILVGPELRKLIKFFGLGTHGLLSIFVISVDRWQCSTYFTYSHIEFLARHFFRNEFFDHDDSSWHASGQAI